MNDEQLIAALEDIIAVLLKEIKAENQEQFFTEKDLAKRWRISPRTLQRRRWLKKMNIPYFKDSRVRYRLSDIKAYEEKHIINDTKNIRHEKR